MKIKFLCKKCKKEFFLENNDDFIKSVMPNCIYCGNNKYVVKLINTNKKRKITRHIDTQFAKDVI